MGGGAQATAPGRRGRFVTFEGIDGTGKSSTLAAVAKALGQASPGLVVTREETDGPAGRAVRDAIARHADPLAVTFLFLADRAEHARTIRGHLDAGRDVLCDRYALSTLAYQSVTLRGRLEDPLGFLRSLHVPLGLEPDHTLLFVGDPQRCVERTANRGATTPYEKVGFLRSVQQAYLDLAAQDPRVHRIDAETDLASLHAKAARIVRGWLAR